MADTLHLIHPDLRSLAVPIDELTEDPDNANTHNEFGQATLAALFVKFGQRKPIVVRREGMIVEAGNGTLAALRAEGWSHLACTICDDDAETAKAFALADNQSSKLSAWDPEQLRQNAEDLLAANYDVIGLGFQGDELADILAGKVGALAVLLGEASEENEHGETCTHTPENLSGDGANVEPSVGKGAVEIDVDAMEFAHECPRCKFEFNDA